MANARPESEEITVILPPEPPELYPQTARVLLRILLKAREKQLGHESRRALMSDPYLPATGTLPGIPGTTRQLRLVVLNSPGIA